MNKQKLDIICLQEKNIKRQHRRLLINHGLGQEFISSDKTQKRGVVMYVNPKLDPKLILKDEKGRIMSKEVRLDGESIIVVGIYAPNDKLLFFLKKKVW